ncbi:MAG: DUF4124 domain-containing protein [Chromatiales bacterium]|nr:DUF4124 domain-containing protein [Chromatiales bacterium]
MTTKLVVITLAGLLVSAMASADIYRWKDADGVTHYTDTPPEGVVSTLVSVDSRPTDKARISSAQAQAKGKQQAQFLIEQEERVTQEENSVEAAKQAEERAQACTQARQRLETYNNSRRLYRELENGEREWYSEEEVALARQNAQKAVEEFCD